MESNTVLFASLALGARPGREATPAMSPQASARAGPSTTSSIGVGSSGASPAPSDRPRTGKGSRGPRPRLFKKGECQADGCAADLNGLPRYHQRNHICMHHKTADSFFKQGVEVRFCQRCGVSHVLADFDGLKKSCRKQLAVHNSRRRKTVAPTAAPAPATSASAPAAPAAAAAPVQQELQAVWQPQQQWQPQLGAGGLAAASAELPTAGADWDASLDASPEVSVGSAAELSEDLDVWLLADTGSGGGGDYGDGLRWGPSQPTADAWQQQQQQAQQLASSGVGVGMALPSGAAFIPATANERVCCGTTCGACGDCCTAAAAAGPAAVAAGPGSIRTAAAAGAGSAGCLGCAPVTADDASCSGCPAGDENDTAHSSAQRVLLSGSRPAGATAAGSDTTAAVTAAMAAAALEQLQQQNAALYKVFVQQQLLAAQTLLTAAGMVLTQRLPLPHPEALPAL